MRKNLIFHMDEGGNGPVEKGNDTGSLDNDVQSTRQ